MLDGLPTSGSSDLNRDAADLAEFGYRQRLDRNLGGFSSFAASFSYLSILTGLPQLFYLGFHSGGPAFFWTWPTILLGQMLVGCCFAELAAEFPLSGGVYQWARQLGSGAAGWMAGWVALACAVVSMASVSLALQGSLPRIIPWFQWVGSATAPTSAARNAVLLGCGLIALSTAINIAGVRLLALINNVGVFAELVGVALLVLLLFWSSRRGPSVVLDTQGRGLDQSFGYLTAFLAAALTPSFVMYGFDTAGTLAEETVDPRRLAPRAILGSLVAVGVMGSLLILAALQAAPDLTDPGLGQISGGMHLIINGAINEGWGWLLLADVVLAIVVCTFTIHASAVRLVFAMARDNSLPGSARLAALAGSASSFRWPAFLLGLAAMSLLVINVNSPSVVGVLASVAIVWANLSYLFVTVPQLARRLRTSHLDQPREGRRGRVTGYFNLGRWGLPINLVAVVWSVALVVNIGWPRSVIYGDPWYERYVAIWATLVLVGVGACFQVRARRRGRSGVLAEHRAFRLDEGLERAVEVLEE